MILVKAYIVFEEQAVGHCNNFIQLPRVLFKSRNGRPAVIEKAGAVCCILRNITSATCTECVLLLGHRGWVLNGVGSSFEIWR